MKIDLCNKLDKQWIKLYFGYLKLINKNYYNNKFNIYYYNKLDFNIIYLFQLLIIKINKIIILLLNKCKNIYFINFLYSFNNKHINLNSFSYLQKKKLYLKLLLSLLLDKKLNNVFNINLFENSFKFNMNINNIIIYYLYSYFVKLIVLLKYTEKISSIIKLPASSKLITVLRSPHTDKKSREQYVYKYRKLIYIFYNIYNLKFFFKYIKFFNLFGKYNYSLF